MNKARLPSPSYWKCWLRRSGTLIACALLIWLLAQQDWALIRESLAQLPIWALFAAFMLFMSGVVANALRWYLLLRAQQVDISFINTVKIVFAGSFASNFLPSTIGGDALRIIGLSRFTRNKIVVVSSVFLDRALNILAMSTVLPLAGLVLDPSHLASNRLGSPLPPLMLGFTINRPTAMRIHQRLQALLTKLKATLQIWYGKPLDLLGAFLVSWASVFVIFLAVWTLAVNLSIPVNLYHVMGASGITYFLTLLPISINGYGLREVAFITLYRHFGATLEQASSLALITRLFLVIETLPGGLWMLAMLRDRRQDEDHG